MAKRRNRFWVERAILAHGGGYEVIKGKGPKPNPYRGADTVIAEIDAIDFHAASDIRLKPGQGPVEIEGPLFRAKTGE